MGVLKEIQDKKQLQILDEIEKQGQHFTYVATQAIGYMTGMGLALTQENLTETLDEFMAMTNEPSEFRDKIL